MVVVVVKATGLEVAVGGIGSLAVISGVEECVSAYEPL